MCGRFVGSAVLQRVKTGVVLGATAACALILVFISIKSTYTSGAIIHFVNLGHWHGTIYLPKSVPMWSMLAVGFCNSIMFPSIFTLGIQDLGPLTSKGSSLLIASILGGAIIPKLQGILANHIGLQPSFVLPAICYIYVAIFGIFAIRRPAARDTLIPSEPV
jgi:FHS family L-fucose permease-like MFS transporter